MLAERNHRREVIVQGEEYELVAAVADEEMAAVDLLVNGVRDEAEDRIACEVSARIIDGLEVIHVKDGEREFESAVVGERGEFGKAAAELMTVVAARKEVALRLVLRDGKLAYELLIFLCERGILQHLLADRVEDERNARIDREYGGREHGGELMIFPVQRVDAAEEDDRRHGEGGVAAGRMMRPARSDKGVDEDETADEEDRIQEAEQIHIAVELHDLHDGRRSEQDDEYVLCRSDHGEEARRDNVLRDPRTDDGHDVEHDEVELPPEICHAVDAREERGASRCPQDEAREVGDEIELHAAAARFRPAPRQIHDEKDDQRGCDRQARDVDRICEAEAAQEEARRAEHKVVHAAEPVRIA